MSSRRFAVCLFVCIASLLILSASASAQTGDWTFCASEGGFCAFTGTTEVRYGANGSYYYRTLSNGTACTNGVFGDPIYGTVKQCAVAAASTEWTLCAGEGGTCAFTGTKDVRYGANGSYFYRTLSNGTPCTNSVFGDPIYGTAKQCDIRQTTAPSGYGPSPAITCPAGAVDIVPGASIQLIVNSHPGSTTFCLRAGVHYLTSSIKPKSGNTFVGEYGAVLDGTGWTTTDPSQAAFRAHEEDIDNVTIRNLVIRSMPQRGIQTYHWVSAGRMVERWTIEYNEVAYNKWGIVFAADFTIRNNYIHHNVGNPSSPNAAERGGGYAGALAHNTIFESNEIAYNGMEQKVGESTNVTFRNNFIHHNLGDGIWYDGNCRNALVEGNRAEDNGRNGIFYEISSVATIRNNTLRRNGGAGVFVSTSERAEVYNNTLDTNFGGIIFFVNCDAVPVNYDLINNSAHDNSITIGTQSGTWSTGFSYTLCTSTQLVPYLNGSKNLTFSHNAYRVPSLGWTKYFVWDGLRLWEEWQGRGHDLTGSISQ